MILHYNDIININKITNIVYLLFTSYLFVLRNVILETGDTFINIRNIININND